MRVRARQDICCGEARSLLWQDIKESTKGGGAKRRPPLWRRPKAASLMSWHKRDLVLPQQRSCLATTHILSCHNRDLVLPQQRLGLPSTEFFWLRTDSSGSEAGSAGQKNAKCPKIEFGCKNPINLGNDRLTLHVLISADLNR